MSENQRKPFKDYFDTSAAQSLAKQMAAAMSGFDQAAFVRRATRGLSKLAFNARIKQFADALAAMLPDDIPEALAIVEASLPDPLPDCEEVTDGFLQWPLGQFIADHGLPYFEPSMSAMVALTQRFSSEFAVRPFVEQRAEETFERLLSLTTHQSPHVRRFCSEGVRPRLPWGKKLRALVDDPSPIWAIVEALKDDPELYVRRSVANNLNDIAKDHAEQVIERCKAWKKDASPQPAGPERDWLINHGLRTLIKAGHPGALAVIGYGPPKKLTATLSIAPQAIEVGGEVSMTAALDSAHGRAQQLLIDYVVHYVRKAGHANAKVFKWTTSALAARGTLELTKRHPMKVTSVRALYPGVHKIELQINGQVVAEASFELL
jgi:3-methyladenine DNA glycosylase AlkC